MNKSIIGLFLCLSLTTVAWAQPAPSAQNPFAPPNVNMADVPLTAASVKKVIAAFSRLREEFKDYKPSPHAKDIQEYVQARDALEKGEKIVSDAGFKDWADWHANFAKVMQTYMAYKMQESGKINQAQMQQQIQALQNNPNMTPEQKQMAMSMMSMATMYTQMAEGVSETDLKTLAPFAGQLEQVFKAGEKK